MSDEFQRRIIELLPRLRRFAYSLTGDLDRADDLVQDTCLRALSSASQWQPGTRLDSWMYRIAQNSWFDQMRARKVRGEVVDLDNAAPVAWTEFRDALRDGKLDLLYVAPERATSDALRSCSMKSTSRCSRSTRRIASANGGMISGPIIACSSLCSTCTATFRASR